MPRDIVPGAWSQVTQPRSPMPVIHSTLLEALALALLFTLLGIWFNLLFAISMRAAGEPVTADLLMPKIAAWTLWGLVMPLIHLAGRRFPVTAETWIRNGLLLFTIVFALAIATEAAFPTAMIASGYQIRASDDGILRRVLSRGSGDGVTLKLILSFAVLHIGHALGFERESRERERRSAELRMRFTRARLQVLRMQLHPHFLFNTLNSVASLIRSDQLRASSMTHSLSTLLRASLSTADDEVALRDELALLDRYLEIERIRFGERLRIERAIEDEILDCLVPSLLLQPIVENAVRHGVATKAAGGTISIIARRSGDSLQLRIEDDGEGMTALPERLGIGLSTTRSRLAQLYGDAQAIRFEIPDSGRGLRVAIDLPLVRKGES
ncbi:MAG TPA: histidine kinase [Thermoanaerobaculia bacterium]|nr:histidine kinase [Thermoanaerobaculia bacterium]